VHHRWQIAQTISVNTNRNPGNYGIVTSAIVKVYPEMDVTVVSINFATGNGVNDTEIFWSRVNSYFKFGKSIVAVRGFDRNYIMSRGNSSFSFTTQIELPNMVSSTAQVFIQPLINSFNSVGSPIPAPTLRTGPYGQAGQRGMGTRPGGFRFASRLFPRANWNDDRLFESTMSTIRYCVEGGGYTFHGLFQTPTREVAGYPGEDSGVNPAFRTAIMHADITGFGPIVGLADEVRRAHDRLNNYMEPMRLVTRGSGAYINEADVEEPDWKQSFFGSNYPRLLQIKKRVDPWGVFWAPVAVASDEWEVKTEDGLPSQNGRLCRVRGDFPY
jgi:hypothetical protein